MKHVKIFAGKRGKVKGQFRYVFFAANGVKVGTSGEYLHNKKDLLKTLKNNFPDWPIIDTTINKPVK